MPWTGHRCGGGGAGSIVGSPGLGATARPSLGSRSDAGGQPGTAIGSAPRTRPVSPGQARSAHLVTSHRDLVAEHQNLRILRRGAAGQQPEPGHKLPEDQIQQSNSHGWRSCPTTTVQQYRTSALRMTCSAPTGSLQASHVCTGEPPLRYERSVRTERDELQQTGPRVMGNQDPPPPPPPEKEGGGRHSTPPNPGDKDGQVQGPPPSPREPKPGRHGR